MKHRSGHIQPVCLQRTSAMLDRLEQMLTHTHHSIANEEAKFKCRFLKNLNQSGLRGKGLPNLIFLVWLFHFLLSSSANEKKKKKPGGRRKGGRYLGLNEILLFSKICNMIFSLSHRQFLSCSEVRTIVNFDT